MSVSIDIERHSVARPDAELAVFAQGDTAGPVVLFAHSILSSSAMWERQADLLAARGYRVLRADARGHGDSRTASAEANMDLLAEDSLAVLDALAVERAHYVGLSLGGMSGFGLALRHADRLASLCLCDARADAPPAVAAPWDERMATARAQGCGPLAGPTLERWFGAAFLAAEPAVAARLRQVAASTSVAGFIACACAIQQLDYLPDVGRIQLPVTLIVGENDGVLPEAMAALAQVMPNAVLERIPAAGHLPNIDQPAAFDAALLRHLERCMAA